MQIAFLIPEYFEWHYTKALREHLNIISNFIWFTAHFFAIPVLSKTLFSPLLIEQKSVQKSGLTLTGKPAEKGILRSFGAIVRLPVIIFGLLICGVIGLIGAAVFLIWLLLPAIVAILLIAGLSLILS